MTKYSVYAVTPKGQMLGPIYWVEASSDDSALTEALVVTDHVLGAKVLQGGREVGTLPPRTRIESH